MKIFHIANSVEPVGGRGEGVAEGGGALNEPLDLDLHFLPLFL